jgi:hypothetical protein
VTWRLSASRTLAAISRIVRKADQGGGLLRMRALRSVAPHDSVLIIQHSMERKQIIHKHAHIHYSSEVGMAGTWILISFVISLHHFRVIIVVFQSTLLICFLPFARRDSHKHPLSYELSDLVYHASDAEQADAKGEKQ